MRYQLTKFRNFNRRAIVLGGMQGLLLSALGGNLFYLQVTESEKYNTLAEGNRIRLFPILPKRGKILDRSGEILAEGHSHYQALFDPAASVLSKNSDITSKEILEKLASFIELDEEKHQKLLKKINDKSSGKHGGLFLVKDYLSWEEIAKIEVNSPSLPGVIIEVPEVRNYPAGAITSHLVGYVGLVSKNEIKNLNIPKQLYLHPEFRIGKTGAEKSLENLTVGKPGLRHIEVNARGSYVRELDLDETIPGEDTKLTINKDLK